MNLEDLAEGDLLTPLLMVGAIEGAGGRVFFSQFTVDMFLRNQFALRPDLADYWRTHYNQILSYLMRERPELYRPMPLHECSTPQYPREFWN